MKAARTRQRKRREARRETICATRASSCAVLAGLVAAGCSGGQSDLQKWIADTKKKPGGRIQALPEVKPYETYVYSAGQSALAVPAAGLEQRPGRPCGRARGATANFSRTFRSTL